MNVRKGEICETGWTEKKFFVIDGREGRDERKSFEFWVLS